MLVNERNVILGLRVGSCVPRMPVELRGGSFGNQSKHLPIHQPSNHWPTGDSGGRFWLETQLDNDIKDML